MAKLSSKRQITLPVEHCTELGIEPGDELEFFVALPIPAEYISLARANLYRIEPSTEPPASANGHESQSHTQRKLSRGHARSNHLGVFAEPGILIERLRMESARCLRSCVVTTS